MFENKTLFIERFFLWRKTIAEMHLFGIICLLYGSKMYLP